MAILCGDLYGFGVGLPGQGESEYALPSPAAKRLQPGIRSALARPLESGGDLGDVFPNSWTGKLRQILGTRITAKIRLNEGLGS